MSEIMHVARRLEQAEVRASELRAERDRLIVEAHAQGESPKLLAQVAGLKEAQVFRILRAARDA